MTRTNPPVPRAMLRSLSLRLVMLALVVVAGLGLYTSDWGRAFGSRPRGARLERLQESPHQRDGRFENPVPTEVVVGSYLGLAKEWLSSSDREPAVELRIPFANPRQFDKSPASGLRLTWFGHSTVLIEIDGQRVLTDPVFSERASPSGWFGPKRFFKAPIAMEELPTLDAVVISHDHYDHLDHRTVSYLDDHTRRFLVPLGVGAHLAGWGIEESKIVELDWWQEWQEARHVGLSFVATPARHFSGRTLIDRDRTWWSGWALLGPTHRVYFSGDTGYLPELEEAGRRLGPFDITLLDAGAYGEFWPDVHLSPEGVLRAHRALGGRVLMPIHWGTFDLALHPWDQPIRLLRELSKGQGVSLAAPRPGQSFEPSRELPNSDWWRGG